MGDKHPKPESDLLIFLPTYNERRNVSGLIARIQALPLAADILFIDDNSPDGTGDLLDQLSGRGKSISVIHRPARQGIGSAHQAAIRLAYQQGYQTLITMDADGTHAPEDIPRLIEKAETGEIIIGSRFLSASIDSRNRRERLQSRLVHRLTSWLLDFPADMSSAFRLYRLDAINPEIFASCRSTGYAFFPESLFNLHQTGCAISEVPIRLGHRQAGKSKKNTLDVGQWIIRIVRLRWLRDQPRPAKKINTASTFLETSFIKYCRFCIPPGRRILMLGCRDAEVLRNLRPLTGVGVTIAAGHEDPNDRADQTITLYRVPAFETFLPKQRFDYIILNDILGSIQDVRAFLVRLLAMAGPETRLIINTRTRGWRFLVNPISDNRGGNEVERMNRLSRRNLDNLFLISGYDIIKKENFVLLPYPIPYLSALINRFLARLPLLKRYCLGYLAVVRPDIPPDDIAEKSVSVILTCRDEEGNIEGLVERIPPMGRKTEIVFVEGHSRDGTVGKISEIIRNYPEKDIKLYHQPGIGQGDAFRTGFDRAEGDFLIWLEADLTTPPEEARHLWEAYASGHGEYINGSRFVYPMAAGAMPLVNNLGNRFFSRIMSWVTGQRFTDTLCGFKAIPKNRYQEIINNPSQFDSLDPFGDFLLILGAVKHNLKIAEVPVHYQPRRYGRPKSYGRSWVGLLFHARILSIICWRALTGFRFL